VKKEI